MSYSDGFGVVVGTYIDDRDDNIGNRLGDRVCLWRMCDSVGFWLFCFHNRLSYGNSLVTIVVAGTTSVVIASAAVIVAVAIA
jgi:hypothetical protein